MDVFDRWNATTDDELTTELVEDYFSQHLDELYIASSAVDRLVNDAKLQRLILHNGLKSTESAVDTGKNLLDTTSLPCDVDSEAGYDGEEVTSFPQPPHASIGVRDERLIRLLSLRYIILRRLHLVDTFEYLTSDPSWSTHVEGTGAGGHDFDPWDNEGPHAKAMIPSIVPPFSLPDLLTHDVLGTALQLADDCQFEILRLLMDKHSADLFPYRLAILEAIPLHAHPMEYMALLPSLDIGTGQEQQPRQRSLSQELDWVESEEGRSLCFPSPPEDLSDYLHTPTFGLRSENRLLTQSQLQDWYKSRITRIDSEAGLLDIALELTQVGASRGIPGLDGLGEDLSLLSRLIYDAPGAKARNLLDPSDWSISRWKSSDEQIIIRGYLEYSTPMIIADDIRHLVMPYLYVLEARHERAGRPESDLYNRLLYEYILSAPLELCAPIFDASKPTNPSSTRIIRNDEDLARLALARLYSSEELDKWPVMSNIFECLPDWPVSTAEDQHNGDAEAETTLALLTAFVQPSTTKAKVAPPCDLFEFFKPLPPTALSHALDILDVHLECGEIFARWGVPATLAWFLQSAQDGRQQRAWATRMARRSSFGNYGDGKGKKLEGEKAYASLVHDMVKLVGSTASLARGAFRLLGRQEVTKIFLSGVLSTGKFDIAKALLNNPQVKKLGLQTIEEICLIASREFYDNSESGNMHTGDMKLAYDCLSVPHLSDTIQAERNFIEATSKMSSFRIMSRPGIPITPIEIRLVKDRLTLIARILSENEDAYKYPDVILELVHKLGYAKNDVVSEVKVLAMLGDSALQSEDFENAIATAECMVSLLNSRQSFSSTASSPSLSNHDSNAPSPSPFDQAKEVCWHSCYQLGRQSEYQNTQKKMRLLGHALHLCPPENTLDILAVWRKLEDETTMPPKDGQDADRTSQGRKSNWGSVKDGLDRRNRSGAGSLRAQLSSYAASASAAASPLLRNQGADAAAALAAKTFANYFPLSLSRMGGKSVSLDGDGDGGMARARPTSPDVGSQARQAISRGMGWLIGDTD